MVPLFKLLVTLALSKRGRRALAGLFVYLNSEEGRKMLGRVQRLATGPEARRIARELERFVAVAAERARATRAAARR